MQRNKLAKWGPLIFVSILLLILIYINYSNKNFFKMNFHEILTIGLLVFVSYYFVEKNSDRRIMNAKIEETLSIIKVEMNKINESLFCDGFKSEDYTVINKKISNKVSLLEHYKKKANIQIEVEYIKNATQEMDKMISNHLNDLKELKTILIDINNKKDQIDVRMDNIFKKLF